MSSSSSSSVGIQQPIILKNGKAIQITFPLNDTKSSSTSTSIFHANWLYIHDSCNYMIPSGQKTYSPGSLFDCRIRITDACIRTREELFLSIEEEEDNDDEYSQRKNLLERFNNENLIGSVHPIDMNTSTTTTTTTCSTNQSNNTICWILVITWMIPPKTSSSSSSSSSSSNTKKSYYNLNWLQQWSYDPLSIQRKVHNRQVKKEDTFLHKFRHFNDDVVLVKREEKYLGLRNVNYNMLIDDDDNNGSGGKNDGSLKILDSIFMDGAVIVTDIPDYDDRNDDDDDNDDDDNLPVSIVGKLIGGGSLSHTSLYGSTFHVQSSTNAINIAYTSSNLNPHQDLAYYESKPGIQLLHCVTNDTNRIIGGESILIDVMAAAHEFRMIAPYYFDVLCKCNVTFVKQREGALMTYCRPHIQLQRHYYDSSSNGGSGSSSSQNDSNIQDNHKKHYDDEIVSVHWSPPFEGPIQISSSAMIEDYFQAYAAFELMIDNSIQDPIQRSVQSGIDSNLALRLWNYAREYTWEYRLHPGEMIVFNNTRMLHGRREFREKAAVNSSEDGTTTSDTNTKRSPATTMARHLIGAYTNIDDTLNTYRVLLKQRHITNRVIPNVGNGTGSVVP